MEFCVPRALHFRPKAYAWDITTFGFQGVTACQDWQVVLTRSQLIEECTMSFLLLDFTRACEHTLANTRLGSILVETSWRVEGHNPVRTLVTTTIDLRVIHIVFYFII